VVKPKSVSHVTLWVTTLMVAPNVLGGWCT